MLPKVFEKITGNVAAKTALTDSGGFTRFYEFADADESPKLPYATWQLINGSPDAYLTCIPDGDSYDFQVDVWASTGASVVATAKKIRDALEPYYALDYMGGTERDFESMHYRYIMRFSGREERT